jgi:hypothetical protein
MLKSILTANALILISPFIAGGAVVAILMGSADASKNLGNAFNSKCHDAKQAYTEAVAYNLGTVNEKHALNVAVTAACK